MIAEGGGPQSVGHTIKSPPSIISSVTSISSGAPAPAVSLALAVSPLHMGSCGVKYIITGSCHRSRIELEAKLRPNRTRCVEPSLARPELDSKMRRVRRSCRRQRHICCIRTLRTHPERGASDDIRPGLRIMGFERRATIVFETNGAEVVIVRIFYGGQNSERALRGMPEE